MSEGLARHTGIVKETLPGLKFKVLLNDGSEVVAYPSGKMRHFAGKILLGDKVRVELSPYDLTQGRIIRNKKERYDMKKENEEWKEIDGYDGAYLISTLGNILSKERKVIYPNGMSYPYKQRFLKLGVDKEGYRNVSLSKEGKPKHYRVHRLVAQAFIPNPENKPQVNHINGIRNDNRLENLEWVTASENTQHSFDVLGRTITDEIKLKMSVNACRSSSKKVKINGIVFETLKEASLFHGKNKRYFSDILINRKKQIYMQPEWDIEILEERKNGHKNNF